MGRKKNKPKYIDGIKHHESCVCDRCLDADAAALEDRMQERRLEAEWEKFNRENLQPAHINLNVRESFVIGPFDGTDFSKALYVTCPTAISGTITPRSRRRK